MAKLKTRPGNRDVSAFIRAIQTPELRADCLALSRLLKRVTGEAPVLWGTTLVGFGRYAYRYASGRSGEWFQLGFAPRKHDLTIYVMPQLAPFAKELARLGPHRAGKSCLYLRRLADVDLGVLEALFRAALAALVDSHAAAGGTATVLTRAKSKRNSGAGNTTRSHRHA